MTISQLLARGVLGIALFGAAGAWAQPAARITQLAGTLYAQTAKGDVRRLTLNAEVGVGDVVSTDRDSYAKLTFPDGAEILMRANTRLLVEAYTFVEQQPEKDNLALQLLKGGLRAVSGLVGKRYSREAYRLGTLVATIGIRGTVFDALLCQLDCTGGSDGLYTKAVEDPHVVTNDTGPTEIPAGAGSYTRDRATAPVQVDLDMGLSLPESLSRPPERRPTRPQECF